MKKETLLLAVCLAFASTTGQAPAADLTIVAPGCTSWGLSGNTLTCNAAAVAPVVIAPPPPPPVVAPVVPPVSACGGSTSTLVVRSNVRAYSANAGGFGPATTLVVQFTTGSQAGFGRVAIAEYGDPSAYRTAVLSPKACDFAPQGNPLATQGGSTVTVTFTVGPNSWGYPELQPNTTYFVNVRNDSGCNDSCNVSVDLRLPG